jgi:predicted transcriptional regulator
MTSPQIASASGRRVSEIRRDLAALLRLGAVSREERADGVWWRAADAR